MRSHLITALAVGAVWAGQALAVNTDGNAGPYGVVSFGYEFPDSSRDSDDGMGVQAGVGVPLSIFDDSWSDANALELTYFGVQRDRLLDGNSDYQNSAMLDIVHDFGLFGWGSDASVEWLPRFKPYVLLGVGAALEDALGEKQWNFGANLGAGVLVPLPWFDAALRGEWRVLSQENDGSVPGQDNLIDHRGTIGVQVPLPFMGEPAARMPEPMECDVAVVNPETGRSDCGSQDSDADGVTDGLDQCPGTPAGTPVDARGCPSGGGSDADGDGVPDMVDACPGTNPGLVVDMNGCAVDQTMVLQGVLFYNDSAELTQDARHILDTIAGTLEAQKNLRVEIGGHTDSIGSAAYNLMLSQQRAESVRQYLIGKYIDGSRMTAQGFGEQEPKGSNDTEEGRALNRRVELKLVVE